MVSNINYGSIDATFPIAGKDNDSQGFRDNFGYIQSGLQVAQGEITALQSTAALTSEDNNFNNNQISQAVFVNNSDLVFTGGSISTNTDVVYANGPYQRFEIAGNLTLTLKFPPSPEKAYNMRLELYGVDSAKSVAFAGAGATVRTNNVSNPLYITSSANSRFFDIWSWNSGTNIYIYEINNDSCFHNHGNSGATGTFLFSTGEYHKFTVNQNTTLNVGGFPPAGAAGKITLELVSSDGSAKTIAFVAKNSAIVPITSVIKKSTRVPVDIQVASATNPIILEFWSRDGGNTVYMDFLGSFT